MTPDCTNDERGAVDMDHSNAVRLKATERYLLNELDPTNSISSKSTFSTARIARRRAAAAMFLEQSKACYLKFAVLSW